MNHAPVVLGINRTQDARICLMHGSSVVWAIQKERLTRQKHHWGKHGDVANIYRPSLPGLERDIDVLVECYSSDSEFDKLAGYDEELSGMLRFAPGCKRARMSHHLSHVYSVFHPSPFQEAAVMIIDGQGSALSTLTEHWSGAAGLPGDWREVSSFYRADRKRIECIGKQAWDRDNDRLVGLGMFYFMLTQAIFPGEGNEGKVMGLAPHGDARAAGLPPLEVSDAQVGIPPRWRKVLRERARFRYTGASDANFSQVANLAAAGQLAFEEAVLEVARWLHRQTGADNLCFAGGTALNCSANDRLLRQTPFRNVFIPPAPGDAGTALGCAIYGLTELAGARCDTRTRHVRCRLPAPGCPSIAPAAASADRLVRPGSLRSRLAAPDLCPLGRPVHRLAGAQRLRAGVLHRPLPARRPGPARPLPAAAHGRP